MTTVVSKWGNSLGVRIPKPLADEVAVEDGDAVEISVQDGAIIVRPTANRYSIEGLASAISRKNRHRPTDWGRPVGNESW